MINVFIFGTGISAEKVCKNIRYENVRIIGFLDNDKKKQGNKFRKLSIYPPNVIAEFEYDFIIIASVKYEVITEQLLEMGVAEEVIIKYFAFNHDMYNKYRDIIHIDGLMYDELKKKIDSVDMILQEVEYVVADKLRKKQIQLPNIMTIEESINHILTDRLSVSRYGDGEFDIILGEKIRFQDYDECLREKLQETLQIPISNHMVALADIYGDMSYLIDKYAEFFRERLIRQRERQYEFIDMERVYGNAFITRFYSEMIDKSDAGKLFQRVKQIWNDRDVMIVEGEYTRFGVGNDLLNNASSIQRILAPNENAFAVYDRILEVCRNVNKDTLFLIALGPTATVMAYDLAKEGYQAIDIGHLDLEYEWFLRGVEEQKVVIEGKYTNEVVGGDMVEELVDEIYWKQIFSKVNLL